MSRPLAADWPVLQRVPFAALLLCALAPVERTALAQHDSVAGPPPSPLRGTSMVIEMAVGDTHLEHVGAAPRFQMVGWVDVLRAAVSTRYRMVQDVDGVTTDNHLQYQIAVRARAKLGTDRLDLTMGVFTGNTFTSGWNRTGWGTGDTQLRLFVKQLYLAARPVTGVELQVGGLGLLHGQSTEITGLAYDGFVSGERLVLALPRALIIDEIAFTLGHLGDLDRPGVGARLDQWTEPSYHQILLVKRWGARAVTSADYARAPGGRTLHQAVRLEAAELPAVDVLHFEQYQRLGADPGYGFAAYAEQRVLRSLTVGGGYASVGDRVLNSSRYGGGKRVFVTGHLAIGPVVSVSGFVTRRIGTSMVDGPSVRLDLVVGYNLLGIVRRPRDRLYAPSPRNR